VTFLSIVCYFAFLCLSIGVIVVAFNLTKTYPHKFLIYYLYYLVFFYVHGFMYFIGSSFNVLQFLPRDNSIVMALTVTTILAAPAQIFYLFFMILWVADILGNKPSVWFKGAFFLAQTLLIAPVIMKLVRMLDARNSDISVRGSSLFSSLSGVVFYLTIAYLFIGSWRRPKEKKKELAKTIGLYYLVAYPIMIMLTDRIDLPFYANPTLMLLFLTLIDFSLNIPPLLYLRWFLKKNPLQGAWIPPTDVDLQEYFVKYKLTRREQEIVELILAGKGTKEIGEKLFISGKTVKNNLSNIFQKTGAKNRVQLMSFVQNLRR
jgi:DNA-binding CsgD family transcriptional regulator